MILLKIEKLSDYITLFIYDKNYLYRAGPGPVEGKNLFFVCLFVFMFCSSKCFNDFFMDMYCFHLKNVSQNDTSL